MPLIETPAIILSALKLGDADKLMTTYTLKRGRLKGVAVGARRMKSRFGAALEPFTHCTLAIAEKGGERLARIGQADIVHPFQKLREDWEGLSLGVRMLRAVERVTPEGDPNPGIFQLLCDGLHALEKGLKKESDRENKILIFTARLVAESGYQPLWEHCLKCRADLADAQVYFSAPEGGCLCRVCAGRSQGPLPPVSQGTLAYLRLLKKMEGDRADRLKPSVLIRKEVSLLFGRHLAHIAGRL